MIISRVEPTLCELVSDTVGVVKTRSIDLDRHELLVGTLVVRRVLRVDEDRWHHAWVDNLRYDMLDGRSPIPIVANPTVRSRLACHDTTIGDLGYSEIHVYVAVRLKVFQSCVLEERVQRWRSLNQTIGACGRQELIIL